MIIDKYLPKRNLIIRRDDYKVGKFVMIDITETDNPSKNFAVYFKPIIDEPDKDWFYEHDEILKYNRFFGNPYYTISGIDYESKDKELERAIRKKLEEERKNYIICEVK